MITSFFHFLKPFFSTFILIGALHVTGLWENVSTTAQMIVLKTGLFNVEIEEKKSPDDFDYSFTIKDLTGQSVSFNRYKGKVLFINLWATWCGPCRAEMPGIQSLSEKLKGQPVEFIALSIDKESALQKVKTYISDNQYTFPVYMLNGYLPELLHVPSIPTTFVVSKDGKILMKEMGTRNYNTNKMVTFLTEQARK